MAEKKSELVFVRRKGDDEKDIEPGHAVGVSEDTAKGLLLDPSFEKCKSGEGWAKRPAPAK